MRGIKTLVSIAATLAGLALASSAHAQISVSIGVPPTCQYGYYGYAPYGCAPMGYYGSGYFYNGIFVGIGPWAGWGYNHGWGSHRFSNDGGGRYHGGVGHVSAYRGHAGGEQVARGGGRVNQATSRAGGARPNATHVASPVSKSHGNVSHGASGQAHGRGESHGEGGQAHGSGGHEKK